MRLLVDSSVWIDYFNGIVTPECAYLHNAVGEVDLVVGDLILAEVLQGFRREKDFETARNALLRFPVVDLGGAELAEKSASNYRFLRSKGITVRTTIDCLIATFCIERDSWLLQKDRDFNTFSDLLGLQLVIPPEIPS